MFLLLFCFFLLLMLNEKVRVDSCWKQWTPKSKESRKTNSFCAYRLARNALCHVIGVVSEWESGRLCQLLSTEFLCGMLGFDGWTTTQGLITTKLCHYTCERLDFFLYFLRTINLRPRLTILSNLNSVGR